MTNQELQKDPAKLSVIPELQTLANNGGQNSEAYAITQLAAEGKIDQKAQMKIAKTLGNPNKMKSKGYQYLMKSIAKNKFGKISSTVTSLLDALSMGGKAEEFATEELRKISASEYGPMSSLNEKKLLKNVSEAIEEQIKLEAIQSTGAKANAVLDKNENSSRLDSILKLEIDNLKVPNMPADLVKKLDEYGIKEYELVKKALPKYKQLKDLYAQLESDPTVKSKIDTLNSELEKIEEQVSNLRNEAQEFRDEQIGYFNMVLKLLRDCELTKSEVGINPANTENIFMREEISKLKIKKVSVVKDEDKSVGDPTETGVEILITYVDKNGKEQTADSLVFRKMLMAADAESEDVRIEDIPGLKEGAVYQTSQLVDPNSTHKELKKFTVKRIYQDANGQTLIELDKPVLKTSKNKLPNSMDDSVRHDRVEQTYTPGGFFKLINTNDYRPEKSPKNPQIKPTILKNDNANNKRKFLAGGANTPSINGNDEGQNDDKLPELDGPTGVRGRPEALQFDEVFKAGDMTFGERNVIENIWMNTRFLSVGDLWEMGKSMYEYYIRRFERRQKEKYSTIGQELPFFAPEMRRVNQSAETEQVQQFIDSFDQKGVYEIQDRLRLTTNRDEMKAAFTTLTNKGQMRWDDISMWNNLNKFLDDSKKIPIPKNGDPYTVVSKTDKRNGMEFMKDAIDSIWGEGSYNDWYSKNKSTFRSNSQGYAEEGKELENLDGGHRRKLSFLLKEHKEGRYVDPHEYEGLIIHAIDNGKAGMEDKLYYMIAGVAYENDSGRTILSMDRMAHINSEMLGKFPILDYICASVKRKDGGSHKFTKDDYKQWLKYFDQGDPTNCVPTQGVHDYLWRYILPSDETQNRINKALRDAERIDHEDLYVYVPPATESVVKNMCQASAGNKKYATVKGYANVFPGFSKYLKELSEAGNKKKLVEGIKSYVVYAGILTNRFEKAKGDSYQRLDVNTLNSRTIMTPETPKQLMEEMDNAIKKIVYAYGDRELIEMVEKMYTKTGNIELDPDERKKQQDIDYAFQAFGEKFHQVVGSDGGEKMINIMASANLTGMSF
ncbi:hypothetical protein COU74_00360 [Candidatus Peregrinibacteria bacterium CG10_big_fil_rev_8_21_14_0_10_36_19]|nr:MAG: hypothetical protein COU74_00360 [Candidatus Peregrinibacteria bacterium CG10_big_fil_rev_8_21_14_0_10_36_19]